MHKRLLMLAALLALFALSTLAGHAFADSYSVSMPTQCPSPNPPNEWGSAYLYNGSGSTIQIKRWVNDSASGKLYVDSTWQNMSNGVQDDEVYIRHWPTDLLSVGWDVSGSPTGVSSGKNYDECRY